MRPRTPGVGIERLAEAGVGQEVEDLRVARNLGAWQGCVACTRHIRALAAEDLLDITEVLKKICRRARENPG